MIYLRLKKYSYFLPLLIAYPATGITEEASTLQKIDAETSLITSVKWESRYVSEGRDYLDDSGIQTTTFEIQGRHFNLSVWNGWGYDSEYDELQITPSFNQEFSNFDVYIYYNYKHYFEENRSENEIGTGLSYNGLPYNLAIDIDWYHLIENDGSFYMLSAGSNFSPVENLTLKPALVLGINDGYISDGHNGANNAGIQLNIEYEMTRRLNVLGYLRYNIAIGSDPDIYTGDILLKDFIWIGMGIEAEF